MRARARLSRKTSRKHRAITRIAPAVAALSLWAQPAFAGELVQLVSEQGGSSLVQEALVRVRAELSTIGFEVVSCPSDARSRDATRPEVGGVVAEQRAGSRGEGLGPEGEAGATNGGAAPVVVPTHPPGCVPGLGTGRIEVRQERETIELRATSRENSAPLEQTIDVGQRQVSAEVVAIRAVELLRAAMLGALRGGELAAGSQSPTSRFTGWAEDPHPGREPAPPEVVAPPDRPVEGPAPAPGAPRWSAAVALGPWLHFPAAQVTPGLGGELSVDVARAALFLGASVAYAPVPAVWETVEGQTELSSLLAVFRGGWAAPCGELWACHLGLALGMVQYDFRVAPRAPYLGTGGRHLAGYTGADLSLTRFFENRFGVFLRAEVGGAWDAPQLQAGETLALSRPSWGGSLGVAFR